MYFVRRKSVLLLLAVLFLLTQAVANAFTGATNQVVSYFFGALAPLLAVVACGYRAVRSEHPDIRSAWSLTGGAIFLWSLGMILSWKLFADGEMPIVATLSDFSYFMYGVPILLAISSASYNRPTRTLRLLDAMQVTLAGYLAYVAIYAVMPFVGAAPAPIPIALVVTTFNVENLALACCATLRLLAHRVDNEEGRYYQALTLFLWLYGGFAWAYNDAVLKQQADMALLELLGSVPFLLLAVLALLNARQSTAEAAPASRPAPTMLTLLIDNFSPIFFTAALLGLGFFVMQQHFHLAIGAIFIALVVYAFRSATLQSRYIRSEQALQAARDHLEQLALLDGLTGVANRRCFDQRLAQEWQRHARGGQSLALLMVDIDFFKSLNDTFGHPYGDVCLARIAQALHSSLPRSGDLAARYGGEEFAVILPATDRDGAYLVASQMRQAIVALAIDNAPERGGSVTVSIGLAVCTAFDGPAAALVVQADQALYRAKQNGRNRIECGAMA